MNDVVNNAIKQIQEVGYCRIANALEPSVVDEALKRVKKDYAHYESLTSDDIPFLNIGQPTLYNLQNKDLYYLRLLFDLKNIEQILIHFLNDRWFKQIPQDEPNYILRSFITRSSNTQMPLHIDSFVPYLGNHVFVMQFSIVLQDQTTENGCTVVVPRSHVGGEYATQDVFEQAVPIESKAGDIVMWDSRLWHGTTANESDNTRWAIIATFCRWWMKQHWNMPRKLPQEIYEQLSNSDKAILGFCSISNDDESEGIDLKRGYESLAGNVSTYQT